MRSAYQSVTSRPLSDFVDLLWLAEDYRQPHASERLLPTGSMGLVLSLDQSRRGADVVAGAQSRFTILDTSRPLSLIGVRFKPGGGFPFFGVPAGALQDCNATLDTLWGQQARSLREQLLEADTPTAKFRILERFLLHRLRLARAPARNPAVEYAVAALSSSTTPSVASVVEHIGSTPRRFIEAFRDQVGLTPKVFSRISRFRRAIDTMRSTATFELTTIALECGYFDQAHFIHDFRAFAGVSPSAYLRHRTSTNHVRVES
jgi:AraC-like DNA-binding protein